MTADVVIATRNRTQPLRECLLSIDRQQVLPERVLVVDSSDGTATRELIDAMAGDLRYSCEYHRSTVASAAQQRNLGATLCRSDVIFFLDDDVVLEDRYFAEIIALFEAESVARPAAVSGTIVNQTYSNPSRINRILLGLCTGTFRGSFAAKVLGPAVNFLAADGPCEITEAEWLPSTGVAYLRDIFLKYMFNSTFEGYSFAEDLHLSTRVAREHRLLVTTRARIFHADMGKDTHRDWVSFGESQVRNRHLIMTSVLGRTGPIDNARLFFYEIGYCSLAWLRAGADRERILKLSRLLRGKASGFRKVWFGPDAYDAAPRRRSPSRAAC